MDTMQKREVPVHWRAAFQQRLIREEVFPS
jgi:hypothetical protein